MMYHFTCDHGYAAILADNGMIRPNRHPMLPQAPPLIWLTDLEEPSADDVGLTSALVRCNRLAHRFKIDEGQRAIPWLSSGVCHLANPRVVEALHLLGRPDHWWIALHPLSAEVS
jgi:hypothetical protein